MADLASLEHLYKKGIVSHVNYELQKTALNNSLNNNQTVEREGFSASESHSASKSATPYFGYIILTFIFCCALFYFLKNLTTENLLSGELFDPRRADRREIKAEIEKTYRELANGHYTFHGFAVKLEEELPLFNQDISSIGLIGFAPLAKLFGKFDISAQNINVYHFDDDNTARIRYNLIVVTEISKDSSFIDLKAKKIGGKWKFDAKQFLAIKSNTSAK